MDDPVTGIAYERARRAAETHPDKYLLVNHPDGGWRLVTDDGYVAARGESRG